MEKLQLVRARGARWHVADVHPYESCTLVTLDPAGGNDCRQRRRLLVPFDDIERVVTKERARRVPMNRWRRAFRALAASEVPAGGLLTAASARIDILPHQLEPALAILRGAGCRVLLADDVGLGKTIQAALILAELSARKCIGRVLVLTPAAVRLQWMDELAARFGIEAFGADARSLRQLTATLPVGMNPWSACPVTIASFDYVKRPEVLPAVTACRWDAVVIDEAHLVAGDSDRHDAADAIASRAAYVVLASATPHSGDESAFAKLCAIGASGPDDRLLIFRRARRSVRPGAVRRVRILRVRPTALEARMFGALAAYERAVQAEHGGAALALSVLHKRAFSTPWALAVSVARRLATLDGRPSPEQLALPLDDWSGEFDEGDEPPAWPAQLALADAGRDRRLLGDLLRAAEATAGAESKVAALSRLLGRARESALVFTEYRDTAAHVRASLGRGLLLHGGLCSRERQEVLAAFERRPGQLLIATDAAGQGLNLQRACRLVVNLELPWNPMRLEQRIGRVDRIGQSRRVHAVHLVSRGSGEEAILERLHRRIARARTDVGTADPLRDAGAESAFEAPHADFGELAAVEAARIAWRRAAVRPRDSDALHALETTPWWLARARRGVRALIGRRTLFIFCATLENELGTTVARSVYGIVQPDASAASAAARLEQRVVAWAGPAVEIENAFSGARLNRERAIAAAAVPSGGVFQAALFDQRAEKERLRRAELRDDVKRELTDRLAQAERQAALVAPAVRLLLVLRP